MGGPCFLLNGTTDDTVQGPPATDNFQIVPFEFDGDTWHSVEQCYQACKYQASDPFMRESLRHMTPRKLVNISRVEWARQAMRKQPEADPNSRRLCLNSQNLNST